MTAPRPEILVEFRERRIRARRIGPAPLYDPLVRVIEAIRSPCEVMAAFDRWQRSGETPGFIVGVDVASLYFEPDGVVAEISLSAEDFEERISYDALEPISRSWRAAWDSCFV